MVVFRPMQPKFLNQSRSIKHIIQRKKILLPKIFTVFVKETRHQFVLLSLFILILFVLPLL